MSWLFAPLNLIHNYSFDNHSKKTISIANLQEINQPQTHTPVKYASRFIGQAFHRGVGLWLIEICVGMWLINLCVVRSTVLPIADHNFLYLVMHDKYLRCELLNSSMDHV